MAPPLLPVVESLRRVLAERDALLRGATLVLGGLALLLAGTLVGLAEGKWMQVAAGSIAVTGLVVAFLGVFLYVVPPLLPDR